MSRTAPYITPSKLLGKSAILPIECKYAFICYTPMPLAFAQYEFDNIQHTSDRYFIHSHNSHVAFCQYEGENFVVVSEVYGGPMSVTTIEELHFYGIRNIIGIGFVGSFYEGLKTGTKIVATRALVEPGTTPHYCITDGLYALPISFETKTNLTNVTVWTTNALYREYAPDVVHAKEMRCEVVNMDTSHLYAATRFLNMRCAYYAVVTDVLKENKSNEWHNDLMQAVTATSKSGPNLVGDAQKELIEYVLELHLG